MSLNIRGGSIPIEIFLSVNRRIRSFIPIVLAIVITVLAMMFSYLVIRNYTVASLWDMDFFFDLVIRQICARTRCLRDL